MRVRKLTVLFLSFMGLLLATWVVFGQTRRVDDLTLNSQVPGTAPSFFMICPSWD